MSEKPTGNNGLHPLAWVGIGCGGLLLVGIVLIVLLVGMCKRKVDEIAKDFGENPERAAAEMIVRMNPEFEQVSSDDVAGTMTIRDKKSGKKITLKYSEIGEGKFSVTTEEGTTTIEGSGSGLTATGPDGQTTTLGGGEGLNRMPKMFELPQEVTGWTSLMHAERDGKASGMVGGESTATVAELETLFTRAVTAGGFKEVSRVSAGLVTNISFENSETKQTVTVSLIDEGSKRRVQLTYASR